MPSVCTSSPSRGDTWPAPWISEIVAAATLVSYTARVLDSSLATVSSGFPVGLSSAEIKTRPSGAISSSLRAYCTNSGLVGSLRSYTSTPPPARSRPTKAKGTPPISPVVTASGSAPLLSERLSNSAGSPSLALNSSGVSSAVISAIWLPLSNT